jgi:lysophospholipase L1-like esterase
MLKTILCYGDSNTWGYSPATKARYGRDERWTGVLRNELGDGYLVIEEGLNGRTTVWDDPIEGRYKNGQSYLLPCLESHHPLDLAIIMLGTNDLKRRFSVGAFEIAQSAGVLARIVQSTSFGPNDRPPKVLLMAPPPVESLAGTDFTEMFAGAEEKSRQFSPHFRQIVAELGCELLDTAEVIVSSKLDAIHFDVEEHRKLGQAVAARVRKIFNE